jgi:hypothetical protein
MTDGSIAPEGSVLRVTLLFAGVNRPFTELAPAIAAESMENGLPCQ